MFFPGGFVLNIVKEVKKGLKTSGFGICGFYRCSVLVVFASIYSSIFKYDALPPISNEAR